MHLFGVEVPEENLDIGLSRLETPLVAAYRDREHLRQWILDVVPRDYRQSFCQWLAQPGMTGAYAIENYEDWRIEQFREVYPSFRASTAVPRRWLMDEFIGLLRDTHGHLMRQQPGVPVIPENVLDFPVRAPGPEKGVIACVDPSGNVRLRREMHVSYETMPNLEKALTYWELRKCFTVDIFFQETVNGAYTVTSKGFSVCLLDAALAFDAVSGSITQVMTRQTLGAPTPAVRISGNLLSGWVIANIGPELYAKMKAKEEPQKRKVSFTYTRGRPQLSVAPDHKLLL